MADKIRTAVIGLGTIGSVHARWYSEIPESHLVAVCDSRERVANEFAAKYNAKAYLDYRELLNDKDIEAVTIATPHYLHSRMAIDAARAGKHVAVEKPLCKTLHEADEMLSVVRKAGVLDSYLENLCFAPSFHLAKEIVDRGGIGEVYLCKARESGDIGVGSDAEKQMIEGKRIDSWYFDYEKTGGGMLMSAGCHAIQYVRHILGNKRAKSVYAEIFEGIGSPKPKGIEDAALVVIKFEDGEVGQIDTSFYATGGFDDKAEIYGNEGTIFLDMYKRNPIMVHSHSGYDMIGQSIFFSGEGADRGWSFPIAEERFQLGYYHEQRHFLQSIQNMTRPTVNFDDGRATLEIALAAYKCRDTGKITTLPIA